MDVEVFVDNESIHTEKDLMKLARTHGIEFYKELSKYEGTYFTFKFESHQQTIMEVFMVDAEANGFTVV